MRWTTRPGVTRLRVDPRAARPGPNWSNIGKQSMEGNSAKPDEAVPADEPIEVWWPKYFARVRESVEAAERHLGVPAGTISLIPNEPDFIAMVKTYAVIEPILNELIAAGRASTAVVIADDCGGKRKRKLANVCNRTQHAGGHRQAHTGQGPGPTSGTSHQLH